MLLHSFCIQAADCSNRPVTGFQWTNFELLVAWVRTFQKLQTRERDKIEPTFGNLSVGSIPVDSTAGVWSIARWDKFQTASQLETNHSVSLEEGNGIGMMDNYAECKWHFNCPRKAMIPKEQR